MSALLEVRQLSKSFAVRGRGLFARPRGLVRAVDDVTFDLERGRSLGLVGESGSGKSTTARMIVGLVKPTAGSIRLDGIELAALSPRAWLPCRQRIQMVFQDPHASLDPRQTAGSIVAEPLAIHRVGKPRERRVRVLALFESVGLSPQHVNRYPHEFSGGQRQRIGIARALALQPEVLVLDEPVSALDVSIQAQIVNLLQELRLRFALTYLCIAHDLAVVRHLCDTIAVMYLGRLVEIAPRESLFTHPRHPYTQALLSAVPVADPERERKRERIVLLGDPPSPANPPAGCAFHPRCREREKVMDDLCRRTRPELVELDAHGRCAACHLAAQSQAAIPAEA